ncbi:hypothetical protein DXG01_012589 [Tephrocybe rancida]|nr:hypothetical protein DXG01_012589 [Tephrocybe rancida]
MVPKDTPRKARSVPGTSAGLTQDQTCQMLRDSIGDHFIKCSVEVWFQTYAVALPNGLNFGTRKCNDFVERVKAAIDRNILDDNGWRAMQAAKKDNETEAVIYGKLVKIAIVIGEAAKEVDPNITASNQLIESGSQTTIHETLGFFFRSDFRLLPDQPNLAAFLYGNNVTEALSVIYTKRESLRTATQENTAASTCLQLMQLAAATGVFGEVKRKHGIGLKQDKLNYLIQFLLFIITADATQLGYDPTVKRREVFSPDSSPVITYEYEVEGRRYLTEGGPISETAAYHITSRATRVWLVREICSRPDGELFLSSDCFVLRDAWLYSDAKLEREIRNDIFEKLGRTRTKEGKTLADDAEPYFMTFLQDWRVEFDGDRDISFPLPRDYKDSSLTQLVPTLAAQHASGSQRSTPSTKDSNKDARPPPSRKEKLVHHRRQHVRTVYEEVCWSMYEVKHFAELLQTLKHTVQETVALWYMRQAGYVHRDVSARNCLWNIKGKHGILSDLEYARPYRDLAGHDPKTGMPAFMAVEYQRHFPLFLPTEPHDDSELDAQQPPSGLLETDPRLRLVYNYYHDLESVFWIYVWFLHRCVPKAFYNRQSDFSLLHKKARDLFDCDVDGNSAQIEVFLLGAHSLKLWFNILWPFYTDGSNKVLYHLVQNITLVNCLISAYKELEATEVKKTDTAETREGEEQKGEAQDMGKEGEKQGEDQPFFWDEEEFVDGPYECMRQQFQGSIEKLEASRDRVPVVWLNKGLPQKRSHKLEGGDSDGRRGKKPHN